MTNNKKIALSVIGLLVVIAAAVCIFLIGRIMNSNPDYPCITNKEAAKLLVAFEEEFDGLNYREEGMGAFLELAIDKGIMGNCLGDDNFNNGNLINVLEYFGVDESQVEGLDLKLNRKQRAVSQENFYIVYDLIFNKLQSDKVVVKDITVVATPGSDEKIGEWSVCTDDGQYGFYGLFLDGYIDNLIRVYVRGGEILGVKEVVSTTVTYKNVWVYEGDEFMVSAYVEGIDRTFYVEGLAQPLSQTMADLQITDGALTSVQIKTDTVRGKVLSVTNEYVEIEDYGRVPFDPDYKLYKNYNGFGEISYSDILVGYELQDFIVGNGMISGAIVLYPFEVKDIRIMIRNTGFESIYHENVKLSCAGGMKVYSGAELAGELVINPGESLLLDKNSELMKNGRIRIVPVVAGDRISLDSIERSQGVPAYPGFIEVGMDETGLFVVNEVNLEQYLKLVVPSEMPAGYGEEASKVQAVCARSYAYNQLLNNDYMEYGAHIDDSTWYQVYNNTIEYSSSNSAVDATCGQVMTQNGEVITAYYYSTSCGHGSDVSIWGQSGDSCPYITAHTVNSQSEYLDLTTNEAFYKFIKSKNQADFDSTFPLYRWSGRVTMAEVNALYGEKANVGKITAIDVIERMPGGSVNQVVVTGDKGTYVVEGELNARKFFGSKEIDLTNNNGKKFTMSSLPSGFFALNPIYEGKVLAGYEIVGGGYGHGLGMSQNGAYAMTKAGYTYDAILKFFYSGIDITQIY